MSISRSMEEEVSKVDTMDLPGMALPYISNMVTAQMLNGSPIALNLPAYFLRLTFDHLWTFIDLYENFPGPGSPPVSVD